MWLGLFMLPLDKRVAAAVTIFTLLSMFWVPDCRQARIIVLKYEGRLTRTRGYQNAGADVSGNYMRSVKPEDCPHTSVHSHPHTVWGSCNWTDAGSNPRMGHGLGCPWAIRPSWSIENTLASFMLLLMNSDFTVWFSCLIKITCLSEGINEARARQHIYNLLLQFTLIKTLRPHHLSVNILMIIPFKH